MSDRHSPRLLTALVATIGTLALAGCGSGAPTSSSTSTSTPSATPTSTPSAETTATAAAATCDTILTEQGYADLEQTQMEPRAYQVTRTDLTFLVDAGGVACTWTKPQTDISATVAQAPFDETAWAAKQAELEAAGFVESDESGLPFLIEPTDPGGNLSGGFVWQDGQLFYVSTPSLLDSVQGLQE